MIPGLVDAHTHPVWEGDRVHEFAMKVGSFQQGVTSVISQLKKNLKLTNLFTFWLAE